MIPTTDTFEEVLTRAVGVLSLVADVVGQHVELTDPSKDALSSLAGESHGKLAKFTDALPAAIQCQPATVWGDRAAGGGPHSSDQERALLRWSLLGLFSS